MKTIIILALIALILPAESMAKGASGGSARVSTGMRSSMSSSKSSSSSVSKSSGSASSSKSSVASAPKVSSRPTSSTKTVDSAAKKTSTGKTTTGKASVVDESYKPTFRGGYTPPVGSTVQYVERSSSFVDYLPWIYLFNHDAQQRVNTQEAVVTEPDGTEKTVIEEDEGADGLLVLNWIIMIALSGGIIYGIMWLVNYFTHKRKNAYV